MQIDWNGKHFILKAGMPRGRGWQYLNDARIWYTTSIGAVLAMSEYLSDGAKAEIEKRVLPTCLPWVKKQITK